MRGVFVQSSLNYSNNMWSCFLLELCVGICSSQKRVPDVSHCVLAERIVAVVSIWVSFEVTFFWLVWLLEQNRTNPMTWFIDHFLLSTIHRDFSAFSLFCSRVNTCTLHRFISQCGLFLIHVERYSIAIKKSTPKEIKRGNGKIMIEFEMKELDGWGREGRTEADHENARRGERGEADHENAQFNLFIFFPIPTKKTAKHWISSHLLLPQQSQFFYYSIKPLILRKHFEF